ncbi:tyrosine-type recombinase/integrase [Corynebacterium pyruviciproducens]
MFYAGFMRCTALLCFHLRSFVCIVVHVGSFENSYQQIEHNSAGNQMKHSKIGTGSIYRESATGRWRAAFTVGYDGAGRQIRKTVTAKDKNSCIKKRNELMLKLMQQTETPEKISMETWCEKWLREIAREKLHPLVYQDNKGKVRKYIIPCLGAYPVREIGAEEVRELHAFVRTAGVTDRTVQIVHSLLSTILHDAVREGICTSNACVRVDRPRAVLRERPALSVYHAKRVLFAAAEAGDPLTSFWAAALMLGARKGELIGLERSRVDLESGVIDLSWQMQTLPWRHGAHCSCANRQKFAAQCPQREHDVPSHFELRECHGSRVFTRPKTAAGLRVVPIPAPLIAVLHEQMSTQPAAENNLVWVTREGLPLAQKKITELWHTALARAGAPELDFHSARHTTVSLLLEAGVSPEVISQIVGHSSVLSTRNYMHVPASMARDAMSKLGELLA